jgi:hypothetical protein
MDGIQSWSQGISTRGTAEIPVMIAFKNTTSQIDALLSRAAAWKTPPIFRGPFVLGGLALGELVTAEAVIGTIDVADADDAGEEQARREAEEEQARWEAEEQTRRENAPPKPAKYLPPHRRRLTRESPSSSLSSRDVSSPSPPAEREQVESDSIAASGGLAVDVTDPLDPRRELTPGTCEAIERDEARRKAAFDAARAQHEMLESGDQSAAFLEKWVSRVLTFVHSASLDEDVENLVMLQIKPAAGEETFTKLSMFFELLEMRYRVRAHEIERIKFEDLQELKLDASRLQQYLERNVRDDTYVVVVACPASRTAEVGLLITQFKREHRSLRSNVQLGFDIKCIQKQVSASSVTTPSGATSAGEQHWWFDTPMGGLDEVKGMVWAVAGGINAPRTLILGRFMAKGDLTAHMQLHDTLPGSYGGAVEFAGSVKQNGEWGRNSLYNNRAFREQMNAACSSRNRTAKEETRAKLKSGYGDVPCDVAQLEEVKKLFAQGEYKIALR